MLLLTGPFSVFFLAVLGYQTIRVFYRRFVEAWVTEVNLQTMLGVDDLGETDTIGRPLIPSRAGGWMARFERPSIEKAMRAAADAESLVVEVTRLGDTLRYARFTVLIFVLIGTAFSLASVVIATR